MRRVLGLLAVLAAGAAAAERRPFVSAFTRLRVDGPFRVSVTTGSPGATVAGDDRALDAVEVRQDGDTVVVRRPLARGEAASAAPVAVVLSTPALAAAYVIGAGEVTVAGMRGDRIDLSVAGNGALSVSGIDAASLQALSIGAGRLVLAGRAAAARLTVNGAGSMAAEGLAADALAARLDGPGTIAARARLTAAVEDTGLGQVTVAGAARCTVRAPAGGAVLCAGGVAE